MAYEHPSGLPNAISRHREQQEVQSLVFYGKRPLLQGGELNDLQDVIRGRQERTGRLIAKDGDRTEGGAAFVDQDAGTVTLTAGKVYVAGDQFPVSERVLSDVPMSGRVEIGVRLVTDYVTGDQDPSLRGLVPGSLALGEDGAAREIATIYWSMASADEDGIFHQVYLLQDGTIIDQTPPPLLSGLHQAIAEFDRPHGHYIVSGCRVTPLGANGGKQHFSIEEGEANIFGFKSVRQAAMRIAEVEDWDVGAVPGETHPYTGGASQTIAVERFPIDAISQILLTKETTVTINRGTLANGIDGLPFSSVISISSVKQGATTFVAGTDYHRTGNGVDWAPAGAEPLSGSSYNVTLRYRDAVQPTSFNDTQVVVAGGVAGGEVILTYTYKLPRVDLIGLLPSGAAVYIKGVSARANPMAPIPPRDVLALCSVHNGWMGTPEVRVDGERTGVRFVTVSDQRRALNQLEDLARLLQLERIRSEVDRRDPTAKRNMFVDPFTSDYYRDQGVAQTGAVGGGVLQLAIAPTFYDIDQNTPLTLDWIEEVVVEQTLRTACEKINPYQNFTPLEGALVLVPPVDLWAERATSWTSDVTLEFNRGVSTTGARTETNISTELVGQAATQQLPFLRQRSVEFRISGFFQGEELRLFSFDGVDLTPNPVLIADANGEIAGSFDIPAGITAGTKRVLAQGSVTKAEALFTGQGTLEIDIMRRVATINRWSDPIVFADDSSSMANSRDPQAQLFRVPALRQVLGVDFHLCHIGDRTKHVSLHQVTMSNGEPTTNVVAEAFLSMTGAQTGWKPGRYALPITTPADRDHGFVIKTDDADHSISLAGVGEFDADSQKAVTVHPYPVGPRFSSVNARTWTAHQKQALTFRIVAARYPVTTKTVDLGSFDLVNCSDLQVRAVAELPSAACSVEFVITRPSGATFRLLPWQVLQLDEFITETVTLSAVLRGTETLSPILYAPIQLIAGKIATEATYVSRALDISTSDRLSAYLKTMLPAGSTMAMKYDLLDNVWRDLPWHSTEISPQPEWVERNHRVNGLNANQLRLKITLTGGPAARPLTADLGLASM